MCLDGIHDMSFWVSNELLTKPLIDFPFSSSCKAIGFISGGASAQKKWHTISTKLQLSNY